MLEQILEYIDQRDFITLKRELLKMEEADIAEVMEELDPKNLLIVFRLLPKEIAVDVFSYMSAKQQLDLSQLINEDKLREILEELSFDDKIDFLEEMPANIVKKILKNCSDTERKLINQFLNYPEYTAGSLMTIEFADLKKEMTVKDALDRIRRTALDKETIYTCYVMDQGRKFQGTVSLKDLVLSQPDVLVEEIMEHDPIYVITTDDQEEVARMFKKYDLLTMPVVDQERRLVGIITIDDVVDVIEEENTEDFHKMGGLAPSEEAYLDMSVVSLAKKRIIWLLVLLVSATFTGLIMQGFEEVLESMVSLAIFIPMLMDTGGNSGAQSSTLIIRSIALGEITISDIFKVVWKELRVSILVGIVLATFNFIRIILFTGYDTAIALTVSLTLVITITTAKVIGGILPMIAKKFGLDPAIMAAPLITTIVDAIALVAYFWIAKVLLGI